MSSLLRVFEQLNMLKWQITDNSYFYWRRFHDVVVLGDIDKLYLLN